MEKLHRNKAITNEELLSYYLTVPMASYFYKKLDNERPDYVKIKICELLKYLNLSHFSKGEIVFNSEIDDVWHFYILQTQQYLELMDKLPGKQFIHHSSNDYVDDNMKYDEMTEDDKIIRKISFLVSYYCNFGGFSEESIQFWPAAIDLMAINNFTLDQLNNYLNNLCANHDSL